MASALDGSFVEFPNGIQHRVVMGIEDVFLEFRMASDVDLRDPLGGDAIYVGERIEIVVTGRNVNIVYVQKNSAIRPLRESPALREPSEP